MIQQATDHINTISASMQTTSISMQQTGENYLATAKEAKTSGINRRRRRNGYDGDTEIVPDKRTGPKPSNVLNLHV
jgi:hypothetical protein